MHEEHERAGSWRQSERRSCERKSGSLCFRRNSIPNSKWKSGLEYLRDKSGATTFYRLLITPRIRTRKSRERIASSCLSFPDERAQSQLLDRTLIPSLHSVQRCLLSHRRATYERRLSRGKPPTTLSPPNSLSTWTPLHRPDVTHTG